MRKTIIKKAKSTKNSQKRKKQRKQQQQECPELTASGFMFALSHFKSNIKNIQKSFVIQVKQKFQVRGAAFPPPPSSFPHKHQHIMRGSVHIFVSVCVGIFTFIHGDAVVAARLVQIFSPLSLLLPWGAAVSVT